LIAFSGRAKFPMYRDIAPVARRRAVVCRAPRADRSRGPPSPPRSRRSVCSFGRSIDPRVVVAFAVRASVILQTRRSRRFVAYRGRVARHLYFFFRRKRV
jgi:hypothetical protein